MTDFSVELFILPYRLESDEVLTLESWAGSLYVLMFVDLNCRRVQVFKGPADVLSTSLITDGKEIS